MKLISILSLLLISSHVLATELPTAQDPWLRAAPPNAKMMAAYVTLNNQTDQEWTVVGAYAPDFKLAEIHKTIEVDGMLKMREQKNLLMPVQSELVMAPGGLHIMLMMPERRIGADGAVKICLIYQDTNGQEHIQHLDFPVKHQ